MSYYGVSVLITILITSLIAFYLLYKAKELNLGLVISILIGSIILGFTFSPAYNGVLRLLSSSININKKLALVISLLLVLFVFLIFILILSFIISMCIPKKVASIDCCIIIDELISKVKIKYSSIRIKENSTRFFRKIILKLKEIVISTYNLKNKLKKPVDTKQIIDTMGIEKSEDEDKSIDHISDQNLNANCDSVYHNIEVAAFEEVVTTQILDSEEYVGNENNISDLDEIVAEVKDEKGENEDEIIDIELSQNQTFEPLQLDTIEDETSEAELNPIMPIYEIDADSLVLKAFKSKDDGRKEEAIGHYLEALQYGPNNEMIFWIVLDICALYKQLGLSELAKNILEGLVNEYGFVIQPEIKMEIINNLK